MFLKFKMISCVLILYFDLTNNDENSVSTPVSRKFATFRSPQVNPNLQQLNLQCNQIGDIGAAALSHALRNQSCSRTCASSNARALRSLNLSQNRIGSDGAACLAHALFYNGTLHKLELEKNLIGATGVAALADALMINQTYVVRFFFRCFLLSF
jgi:Ran GTPase-activating protein (RanGAP) involved in mRNA processing and transport